MKISQKLIVKIVLFVTLAISIWLFFYFENSSLLRILVLALGFLSLIEINKLSDIIIFTVLYLGIFDFYNIRYGLAIPMAIIISAVFILTAFLYFSQGRLQKGIKFPLKDTSWLFISIIALIVVEIFLGLSLWPIDPKAKSLTIGVVYYCLSKIIYLRANNMLSLKREVSILSLGLIILIIIFSFSFWQGI